MELRVLGCHSATPKPGEFPSSQALLVHNQWLIFDTGEGMQMQLRRYGIKFSRIKHIFITHLHGDHLYGLFGFLSTLRLLDRRTPMHVYAAPELEELLRHLFRVSQVELTYPLHFHPTQTREPQVILDEEKFTVTTVPLRHRLPTTGFVVREKPAPRKLNMEAIGRYPEIQRWAYHKLKAGEDIRLDDGRLIPNAELTLDPPPPRQYAYITDTAYAPEIIPLIQGSDLLYHEATFAESEAHLAEMTGHSTAKQAATIARDAGVKQLLIGHFSSRYRDPEILVREAREIFPPTEAAREGMTLIF